MKNNDDSKKDELRPFIVKKMTPPPASVYEQTDQKPNPMSREHYEEHTLTKHRMTDEHVYEIAGRKNKGVISSIKPLIISGISAIAIGVLLGFIVLRMSTSTAEPVSDEPPAITQSTVAAEEDEEQPLSEPEVTINRLDAYVLQAGVYTEKVNADDMASELASRGYSQIVWEENGQFFVFTNVFSSEDVAKAEVAQMEEIEVYAKQWSVDEQSIHLSEEDQDFVSEFVRTWSETVEEHTSQEVASLVEWEKLAEGMPRSSKVIEPLVNYLDEEIVQASEAIDIEQLVLDTWKLYQELGQM